MFSYFILSLSGIEENALPPFLLLFLRFQRLTLQTYCVYISTFYPCPWIHQNLWLPPGLSSCLNFVFLLYTEGQHVDLGLWGQRLLLFSCSVTSYSLWPLELQHARLPRPSSSPGACLNSCPLSQWYHQTISSSVISFSSCLQAFPASVSWSKQNKLDSRVRSIPGPSPNWRNEWRPIRLLPSVGMQRPSLDGKGWLLAFFSP